MYRMLIVDDEEIITDGLMDIFSRLDLELELYKAYSGVEALELLNRTRMDIVLSDICMPAMDGIQLMETIRWKWPQCKIVFLTGHNDFQYVYQAIQVPGVQYVLKNEGYTKLIEAVRRSYDELDDDIRIDHLITDAKEKLNILETLAHGDFFRYLIHESPARQALSEDFGRLNISLDSELPILIVHGNLLYTDLEDSYSERQNIAFDVKFLAESFLSERTTNIGIIDRYGDIIWFIQPIQHMTEGDAISFEQTVMFLEGTFELIQQACMSSLHISISITLSNEAIRWESLTIAYDKLRQLQHMRPGDGTSMVQSVNLLDSLSGSSTDSIRDQLLSSKLEALAAHLEGGRQKDFNKLFEELTTYSVVRDRDCPFLTEVYYAIALMLLSYINRWEVQDRVRSFSIMQLESHRYWVDAFRLLRDHSEALFAARKCGEQKRATVVINKIRTYIEVHIADDLSLIRLADEMHFNPSYLSRLFKQEYGVNLSEYIEQTRIRKAKELLAVIELKISEVGMRVGYESPQSFTRFFKKLTSITPHEYRQFSESNTGA